MDFINERILVNKIYTQALASAPDDVDRGLLKASIARSVHESALGLLPEDTGPLSAIGRFVQVSRANGRPADANMDASFVADEMLLYDFSVFGLSYIDIMDLPYDQYVILRDKAPRRKTNLEEDGRDHSTT